MASSQKSGCCFQPALHWLFGAQPESKQLGNDSREAPDDKRAYQHAKVIGSSAQEYSQNPPSPAASDATTEDATFDIESSRSSTDDEGNTQATHEVNDKKFDKIAAMAKTMTRTMTMTTLASQTSLQLVISTVEDRISRRRTSLEGLQQVLFELEKCWNSKAWWKRVGTADLPLQDLQYTIGGTLAQAHEYGWDLVEDMAALEVLSGLSQENNSYKKGVVAQIEAMLDMLDAAKSYLARLSHEIMFRGRMVQVPEETPIRQPQMRCASQPPANIMRMKSCPV